MQPSQLWAMRIAEGRCADVESNLRLRTEKWTSLVWLRSMVLHSSTRDVTLQMYSPLPEMVDLTSNNATSSLATQWMKAFTNEKGDITWCERKSLFPSPTFKNSDCWLLSAALCKLPGNCVWTKIVHFTTAFSYFSPRETAALLERRIEGEPFLVMNISSK